jgi:hypothetical protein
MIKKIEAVDKVNSPVLNTGEGSHNNALNEPVERFFNGLKLSSVAYD